MLNWQHKEDQAEVRGKVRCRAFVPTSEGTGLPTACVFEPLGGARSGHLVLTQHGGSSYKDGPDVWALAQALVGEGGVRLVSLDGPVHGARMADAGVLPPLAVRDRFFQKWDEGPSQVARHVRRWVDLIDELDALWRPTRISWVGVSMGTAYGLPLLAQDARIRDAVVGMWGACFAQSAQLLVAARAVRSRVLFLQKWDDELFTRQGQLELFDALSTPDKRLHLYPGGHTRLDAEQMADMARFIGLGVDGDTPLRVTAP